MNTINMQYLNDTINSLGNGSDYNVVKTLAYLVNADLTLISNYSFAHMDSGKASQAHDKLLASLPEPTDFAGFFEMNALPEYQASTDHALEQHQKLERALKALKAEMLAKIK